MQLAIPSLRTDNNLIAFNRKLKDANYDLRRWRAEELRSSKVSRDLEEGLELLDAEGGAGWDLACKVRPWPQGRGVSPGTPRLVWAGHRVGLACRWRSRWMGYCTCAVLCMLPCYECCSGTTAACWHPGDQPYSVVGCCRLALLDWVTGSDLWVGHGVGRQLARGPPRALDDA